MYKISIFLFLIPFLFANPTTYDHLVKSPEEFSKKTVTFTFTYKGVRAHIAPAMIRHGISEKKYAQLQAKDLKLALLVMKKSNTYQALKKVERSTTVTFTGKVKHWNAPWGDKFYYVLISQMKKSVPGETKSTVEDSPSLQPETPSLKQIAKNPQKFTNRKIELSILYLKTTPVGKDYQRIWTLSRLPIVYHNKQKNIPNILRDIAEKMPLKVQGKIKKILLRNRNVYVLDVEKVKASIQEIPRERAIRNRFRRRRN